jgi:hypothetical protein
MAGLKSFLWWLSTNANEYSIDSLYERQRILVRFGLLPSREGRGPGSGVPLTADTLATFLIGLLATDNLREVPIRTSQLCSAKRFILKPGSSRKKVIETFHAAVAEALEHSGSAGSVLEQAVAMAELEARGKWISKPARDALKYAGIQVSRRPWSGIILHTLEVESTYSISKKDGLPASNFISTTSSIENENFWSLCTAFRRLRLSTDERQSS